jgi:hypothetical protein
VCAQVDDPNVPFSTKDNTRETMLMTWKPVDNVQQVCQDEYKRRGHSALNHKVDACSFWNSFTKICTIYTKKNPTMHDLGHEMRHCYQGYWH